jgi:hypothetical protein
VILTRKDILPQLAERYPHCVLRLADVTYACPTWASVQAIWAAYHADRWARNLWQWSTRTDCDDFARSFAQYFADAHALTPVSSDETKADAPAVFESWFTTRTGEGHDINLIFTRDIGLINFEPQEGLKVELLDSECSTFDLIR